MAKYLEGSANGRYTPHLMDPTTFSTLIDKVLILLPSQRYVFLSMSIYDITLVNPAHPKEDAEAPTDVIVFVVRFLCGNLFQPIGALLTYSHIDQSEIIADCVKAYIIDLLKLGLYVLGTVSPPFKIFKDILRHLIPNKDYDKEPDTMIYSVHSVKKIIHIYDIHHLLVNLQLAFEGRNVKFECTYGSPKSYLATWSDLSYVINTAPEFKILVNFLSSKEMVPRRINIFFGQLCEKCEEMAYEGLLSPNSSGVSMFLNAGICILLFFENMIIFPVSYTFNWNHVLDIFKTMTFTKLKNNNNRAREGSSIFPNRAIAATTKRMKKEADKFIAALDKAVLENVNEDFDAETPTGSPENKKALKKVKKLEEPPAQGKPTNQRATNAPTSPQRRPLAEHANEEIGSIQNKPLERVTEIPDITVQNPKSKNKKKKKKKDLSSKQNVESLTPHEILDKGLQNVNEKLKSCKLRTEQMGTSESRVPSAVVRDMISSMGSKKEHRNSKTEQITVAKEMLCTLKGIMELMPTLIRKRIRRFMPDALLTEVVDFTVHKLQLTMNNIDTDFFYGHSYVFMDETLTFTTLSNTDGLYLVSKD